MIREKNSSDRFFPKEVLEQADTLRRSIDSSKEDRLKITALTGNIDQIILFGSGDCYFIMHAAASAFEQLTRLPTRIYEAYDYYCLSPVSSERTLVLGFSSSGKSMYTVQAIKLANKKKSKTVGLTNTPDSQLAITANNPLLTDCGISYTFPTKTTTATLGVLYTLANDIGQSNKSITPKEYQFHAEEMRVIGPDSIQARLEGSNQDVIEAAKALLPCRHLLYVGSGVYRSTAMIGAAKIIETSRRHITACNAEEYLHLVGFSVREQDGVIISANQGDNDREHLVADYAFKQGARVIVVGSNIRNGIWPEGAYLIESHSNVTSAWVDALISMIPMHMLASEINKLSNKNPDIPDGVDVKYVINLLYTGPVAGWKTD